MKNTLEHGTIRSINAAALLIGAAGLLSRILGIARDRMLAAHFGASRALDIYYAAFQIPDFLFTVFLLGAASAAIIPVLIDMEEASAADARRFIRELATIFLVGSVAVWLAAVLLAPVLASRLAPGFAPSDRTLVVMLTRIMMLSPVLLGLSNIVSSVLQSHRRFLSFALSSVFYNIGIIFGILVFLPLWGLAGLGAGVILGAVLHLAIQLPALYSLGFGFPLVSPAFLTRGLSRPIKKVMLVSLPRVIAISASNISGIALVAIASTVAPGSIAVFKFADNLRFVPIGLFGVSFAVAAFPALSAARARGSAHEFYVNFFGTFRSILFWILPIAVFFYVLRAQIVRVALGAGNFSWHDTRTTAAILGILTVAILAESLSSLLIRSFYALGNTKTPLFINVTSAIIAVGTGFFFTRVFLGNPGHPLFIFLIGVLHMEGVGGSAVLGVALGAAVGSVFDFLFLFWGLRRAMRVRFGAHDSDADADIRDMLIMFAASLAAGLAAYGMLRVANELVTLDRFSGVLIQGVLASLAGCAVYGGMLYLAENPEIRHLIHVCRRHMFRMGVLPEQWGSDEMQ